MTQVAADLTSHTLTLNSTEGFRPLYPDEQAPSTTAMVLSRVHVPARQKEITMPFHVDINISAPFAIGDLVARLHLEAGNSRDVVLRQGRFMGTVPFAPTGLHLQQATLPRMKHH